MASSVSISGSSDAICLLPGIGDSVKARGVKADDLHGVDVWCSPIHWQHCKPMNNEDTI